MRGDPHVEEVAGGLGLLGGRMLSPSKSAYHRAYPSNIVLFNASIADDEGRLLWWGDLDLTRDESKLVDLAQKLERRLHILFEGDGGWLDRRRIAIEAAAIVVDADGSVRLTHRFGIERDREGRIVHTRPAQDDADKAKSASEGDAG